MEDTTIETPAEEVIAPEESNPMETSMAKEGTTN